MSLGRTKPIPLTPDNPAGDDALRRALAADTLHRYWVLAFTCSFRPGEDPIVEARLGVRLRLDGGTVATEPPLVTFMEPDRLAKPSERTRTFSFNPKVGILGAEAGAQLSQSDKVTLEGAYVIATGKGQSVAEWFFRRQASIELEGMHDLRMIFFSPLGEAATADIKLTAKIQKRAVGIVPYRARLPDKLRIVPIPSDA